jgi:transposase InsO family protein
VAHLPEQSCRADCRGGFFRGADGDIPFVLVLFAHDRRRIRHVAVTAHPTAAWTAQQIREAFPWDEAPRYLLHDRDHAFDRLGTTARAMAIEDVVTAPHAPWQNPFVERFVGSARRECFDYMIAFNEAGVRKLMTRYRSYYENARTHLALEKDAPIPRPVIAPVEGDIVAIPEVGGLHHRYERRAA